MVNIMATVRKIRDRNYARLKKATPGEKIIAIRSKAESLHKKLGMHKRRLAG